jgi:hypothetical protein
MAEALILLAVSLPFVVFPVDLVAYGLAGTRARLPRLLPQAVAITILLAVGAWVAKNLGEALASILVFGTALLMTWLSRRDPAAREDEALIAAVLRSGRGRWLVLLMAADLVLLIAIAALTMGGTGS